MDEVEKLMKHHIHHTIGGETDTSLHDSLQTVELQDYRISTMTCIYKFGTEFNEYSLYEAAHSMIEYSRQQYETEKEQFRIVGMECFDKPIVGEQIKKKRGQLSKRKFRNQMTMILWSRRFEKHVKVKIFRTGKIQMTGVKSEKDGQECVRYMGTIFTKFGSQIGMKSKLSWDSSAWQIAMMNGDFSVGHRISRELLHSIMCPKYGITSNLDADTYPGVIMKYPVQGKIITISVFSSGKVIVTGANAQIQIETCVKLVQFLCSKLKHISSSS